MLSTVFIPHGNQVTSGRFHWPPCSRRRPREEVSSRGFPAGAHSTGNITMRQKILTALPLVGALTFAAQAHATTIKWTLGGDRNVSGSGTLTYAQDTVPGDPANAWAI